MSENEHVLYEYKYEQKKSFYQHLNVEAGQELSKRAYNALLGGTILWGFVVSFLLIQLPFVKSLGARFLTGEFSGGAMIAMWVVYLGLAFVGSLLLNSENALTCFGGFNLIAVPVGVLVSITLAALDSSIVSTAIGITAVVVALMIGVSTLFPDIFAGWGRGLGTMLLITLLAEALVEVIFHADLVGFDYVVVFIMCGYIGYDWVRANRVPRTAANAISIAGQLYLDIMNLLLRIAIILMKNRKRD